MMLSWTLWRLRSRHADVRRRAAAKLYELRDVRTVEPLLAALNDFNSEVRVLVARTLGEIGDPRAVKPLLVALRTWNSEARWTAGEALVKIGKASVEPLVAEFMEQDADVRKTVADILGQLADVRAVEALLTGLHDRDYIVRRHVARALEAIGWQPESAMQRVLLAITSGQFEGLIAEGAVAVEPLIMALQIDDEKVREGAARALGHIGDGRAVEALAGALTDGNGQVRLAAAEALVRFNDPRAVEPLLATLKERGADSQRRVRAIQALSVLGDAPVMEPLLAALLDPDDGVREAAAKVLVTLNDVPRITSLTRALRIKDATIGSHVVNTLVKMGKPAVIPLLVALEDRDPQVRSRASEVLAKLGGVALEPLLEVLQKRSELRQIASRTLVKMAERSAVPPLVALLRDHDSDVRKTAAETLEALGWQPIDDIERALDAVARQEWEQAASVGVVALEPLLGALQDKRLSIRRGAAGVLASWGWQPPDDLQRLWFALALGKSTEAMAVGTGAVAPLLTALTHWDADGRTQVAELLGQLADPRAVRPLVSLASDRELAQTAIRALQQILVNSASSLAAEDLDAVVALADVKQMRRHVTTYEDFIALKGITEPVDCSHVKRLARRELSRRMRAHDRPSAAALGGGSSPAGL